uniref:RNA-directed RNA polymerase n=1 Tax=ssRNA phage DC TaxID=1892901 RepID=A0A1B3Q5V2_9VIRU|nr:replicase [ssRNA phage DC]
MKISFNDAYKASKSIVSQIRGKRTFNGERLTGLNKWKVISAQKLFVLTLCSFRAEEGTKLKVGLLAKLVDLLNKMDVKHLLTILGDMDSALLQNKPYLPNQWQSDNQVELRFVEVFQSLAKPFLHRWFINNDEYAFAKLHQLYAFQSRLSLELSELRQTAYDAWLSTEMTCFDLPARGREAELISGWFPLSAYADFYSNFLPAHGSGAVSESCDSPLRKWEYTFLTANGKLLLKQLGIQECEFNLVYDWHSDVTAYAKTPCRVVFVNKTWKTYRTISCEVTNNMFLQQGVGRCLDVWLKGRYSEFSRYYSIDSEFVNRRLAFLGSLHGVYDTIDLSAASDSVSWELVKSWFQKSFLNVAIRCTRTKYVTVKDPRYNTWSVYEQTKFAPMGSRMCFPVETIVFGAIAKAACEAARLSKDTEVFPNFVVYGDDIVIRHEATPYLLTRLKECGFSVNTNKSFTDFTYKFCFRESCGAEYLNGIDVCPIRLSRNGFQGLLPDSPPMEYSSAYLRQVAGLIQLANNTRLKIPFVHRYLVENILSQNLPIAWDDGSSGLYSERPSYKGYNLYRRRWNRDYQRDEIQIFNLCLEDKIIPQRPLDYPYCPRRSEYSSNDEYEREFKEWVYQYELWYDQRELVKLKEEYDNSPQRLYTTLVALEKRPKIPLQDESGSPSSKILPEKMTLKLEWVEEDTHLLIPGTQCTKTVTRGELLVRLCSGLAALLGRVATQSKRWD